VGKALSKYYLPTKALRDCLKIEFSFTVSGWSGDQLPRAVPFGGRVTTKFQDGTKYCKSFET
jgi:hypothetical protein